MMLTDDALQNLDRRERAGGEESDDATDGEQLESHDGSVEFPTLHDQVEPIAEGVREREIVGVIVFDASPLEAWEHRNGSVAFETLMYRFVEAVREMRGASIRHGDIVCRNAPAGDSVLVFLTRPRNRTDTKNALDFDAIASRTKDYVVGHLGKSAPKLREALSEVEIGTSLIVGKKSIDPRRQIYRAVRRARHDIRKRKRKQVRELHHLVGSVIAQRDIDTLYQPIVRLDGEETIGYEALSRVGGSFAQRLADPLFSAASKVELEAELDTVCRTLSVDRRPPLPEETKLFINCLPAAFFESAKRVERTFERWMDNEGLEPHQLIFELNENISQSQADRIMPAIRQLRELGLQFALDDMGTGMTNLRLLAELEPTYIKMDISLTRGIGESVRKQALASYLLDLARKSDAKLIAEGLETKRDFETVVELGVDYGQGHLIGQPKGYEEFESG